MTIISEVLSVALSKYSRSSKFLFKEQEFTWNKTSEFDSIFHLFGFHQC